MKKDNSFVWCISYIDASFIDRVKIELERSPEYKDIEAYIPTIKVLRKSFKGKQYFEEVPLLFNYGFFRIPRRYAAFWNYLDNMRINISCIYAWVRDPVKLYVPIGDMEDYKEDCKDYNIPIATATPEDIKRLSAAAMSRGIHNSTEIDALKPGDLITLRGYPFDNMQAELVSIDKKKEQAKVKITMFNTFKEVTVSFDNIFFTLYHNKNYDDSISATKSLDEMSDNNVLDRFMAKHKKK